MDLDTTKRYYENAPTMQLLQLVENLHNLKFTVLGLLKSELQKRGELEAVAKIDIYIQNPKSSNNEIDYAKIRLEIIERQRNGEDINLIRQDIQTRVGNIFDILTTDIAGEENLNDDKYIDATTYIINMKDQNLSDYQIKEKLNKIGVQEKTSEKLISDVDQDRNKVIENANSKLKRRTKNDLIFGPIILIFGTSITILSIAVGGSSIIVASGIIIIGFSKTLRGLIFRQKNIEKLEPGQTNL